MKQTVLSLLEAAGEHFVSGEAMSAQLGITRAAVWKQIKKLRETGYEIQAVTNLGYRLVARPDTLSLEKIREFLGDHPWTDRVTVLETVDSTNNLAKRQAITGAPHGSVFLADEQTGGRGRQGRSFLSPRGTGIYLSLLLRPVCAPTELGHVTAMAAVAACDAVADSCGVRPQIKWTNDLILGEKKLAGILTELSVEWESSTLEYLVIGIGVNCNQKLQDFPEELQQKATSLGMFLGENVDRNRLAAALILRLAELSENIFTGKAQWMARYAENCMTIGRQVQIIRGDSVRRGTATGIDENGALLVRYDSGETGVVFSGEVTVRGENGYL
jgi:BirA family biotin operon repressor/biotin-[acetyl-CoA-carboxylase] ligase